MSEHGKAETGFPICLLSLFKTSAVLKFSCLLDHVDTGHLWRSVHELFTH